MRNKLFSEIFMILQLRMFDSVINSRRIQGESAESRNFRIFPLLNTHGYRAGEGGGGYSRRC